MFLDKAGTALTIWDLIKITFIAITGAVSATILFLRVFKTNSRLAKNLGRKIFIYCDPHGKRRDGQVKNMKREISVLKNSGYFDVPNEAVTDFNQIEPIKDIQNVGIVIIGYDTEMDNFEELVDMAKQYNKPLVVYTFELGVRLTLEHEKVINNYKWYTLSSMPLRLVSDIFAIMASFNYEK